jgi:hypothetical protein
MDPNYPPTPEQWDLLPIDIRLHILLQVWWFSWPVRWVEQMWRLSRMSTKQLINKILGKRLSNRLKVKRGFAKKEVFEYLREQGIHV